MASTGFQRLVEEEGVELQTLFAEPPTTASISYQLAHETARHGMWTRHTRLATAYRHSTQDVPRRAAHEMACDMTWHEG